MPRKYELKARANRQAETRQRIVDAAVHLHASKGPARTSFSEVAERAGVQRSTLYRHFPDERSLFLACSGHYSEQNPLPDPAAWPQDGDAADRLAHGIGELYRFYDRNEQMLSSVIRDAEVDPMIGEIVDHRMGPAMQRIAGALAALLPPGPEPLALLRLLVEFRSWRALARTAGLGTESAARVAAGVLAGSRPGSGA